MIEVKPHMNKLEALAAYFKLQKYCKNLNNVYKKVNVHNEIVLLALNSK